MLRYLKGLLRAIFYAAGPLFCLLCVSSCAVYIKTESKVNSLVAEKRYTDAISDIKEGDYGANNALLYLLDKGYLLHISNNYKESIDVFEKAKHKYDELYTKSVSRILGSWITNDYALPYCGEDFERVLINVFQSLNYYMLGNTEEALVEARDVDSLLNLINSRYNPGEKNVYSEDAFARLLIGILYESQMNNEGYNDAFISYSRAIEAYERNYAKNYNLKAPLLLKENLFSAAEFMGKGEMDKCVSKYGDLKFISLDEKAKKAEVYLIQYNAFSPVKKQVTIPIFLPDATIMPLAFPQYESHPHSVINSRLRVKDKNGRTFTNYTQPAEDIGAIAVKVLENRRVRVVAKVTAVSAGKYFAERQGEKQIKNKYGYGAAVGFDIAANIFNFISNKADLRSWRTLPSEIRVGRLLLEPGEYEINVEDFGPGGRVLDNVYQGNIRLSAGEKKFFIIRTAG